MLTNETPGRKKKKQVMSCKKIDSDIVFINNN